MRGGGREGTASTRVQVLVLTASTRHPCPSPPCPPLPPPPPPPHTHTHSPARLWILLAISIGAVLLWILIVKLYESAMARRHPHLGSAAAPAAVLTGTEDDPAGKAISGDDASPE